MRVDEGKTLNPGLLRHKLEFYRKSTETQNSWGEDIAMRELLFTTRAQVKELAGRELFAVQQMWAEARYQIRMHFVGDVREKDEIDWDGRTLDIIDARDEPGTRRVLTIIAKDHD